MSKEDLQPFIELNTNEFLVNSVNPINSDSLFIGMGVTDIAQANRMKNADAVANNVLTGLFLHAYLVKGEYLISCSKGMVITNRRLFTFYSDKLKSIPVKNVLKYEKSDSILIEYIEDGVSQSFTLRSNFIKEDLVNNTIAKHKSDSITEEELVILSNTKIVLDAKYNFTDPILNQPNETLKHYERQGNRNGLIVLFVIILLIGGCGYYFYGWNKSYEQSGKAYGGSSSSDNSHYNSVTGKKQHKCPWCGGIGRVGYAGDSKAQVDRTGMGLGNPCTTCNGTGWVDDDN